MSSLVGKIIDRSYRLSDQLGAGGMGAVYRASQLLTGRVVALKLVAPALAQSQPTGYSAAQSLRLALAREFQTLASLHHPNVIRVLSYGFDEELGPYFTMELLYGAQTLLHAAAQQGIEGRVLLIAQLLRALVYVHRRGILHRDIKPSNVLVVDGEVKLLDFGIASQSASDSELAGTLEYMAPELLLGRPPSIRSDLYSVGILLYQMLPGVAPYLHESMTSTGANLLGEDAEKTLPPAAISWLASYPLVWPPSGVQAADLDEDDGSSGHRGASVKLPAADLPQALIETLRSLVARQPEGRPESSSAALGQLAAAIEMHVPIETAATRESFLQATELVGRDAELRELGLAMAQTRDGAGSAFLLGGESGIGKSRLLAELRTQALVRGLWVAEGHSVSEGGLYYQEVLPLMRALCVRTELADSEATVLKPFISDIAALIGRSVSEPRHTTPEEMESRLFQTLRQLLGRLNRPLLLLLEDLQWARRETLAWMGQLLPELSRLPILLIGTFRSDESPDLPAQFPIARHLPLRRLGSAEISRLSELMLGPAGKDAMLVSYLERQTEGNIFFLVEVMRALAENAGELQRIHQGELPDQVLTEGIERIVDRRIDQVQSAYRPLLEIAATYGRKLNLGMMERAFPTLSIPQFLVECANAAVLESQGDDWQFAHDKLRENLLRRLPEHGKRQQLHLQIAEILENQHIENPQKTVSEAIIGYHFRQAKFHNKALHYYCLAGNRLARSFLYEEALLHYESAEAVLQLLPSTAALRRQHVEILTKLVQCSILALCPAVNLDRMNQAQRILESLRSDGFSAPEDRLHQARLDHESGRLHTYFGQYRQAVECFERAIPVIKEFQDEKLIIIAKMTYGRLLLTIGKIDRAIALLEILPDIIEKYLGRDIESIRAFSYLSGALGLGGRSRDAVRLIEHVQPWIRADKQGIYEMSFYMNFGIAYYMARDLSSALQFIDRALELSEKSKLAILEYVLWDVRAAILSQGGQLEAALRDAIRAAELRKRVGGRYLQDFAVANHAEILLRLGRSEIALEMAEKAASIAHETGSVLALPAAERVRGCASAQQGRDPAEVDRHLRESLRVAWEAGNRWEVIQTEITWGQVCCDRRDAATASVYFRQARERVTDELFPSAKEFLLQTIDEGLRRCGIST